MKKHHSQPAVPQAQLVAVYRQALHQGVSLDTLNQKVEKYLDQTKSSSHFEEEVETKREKKLTSQVSPLVRLVAWILPVLFVGIGIYLVGSASGPILSHMVQQAPLLAQANLSAPIPSDQVIDIVPAVVTSGQDSSDTAQAPAAWEPKILDVELDYTNLSNWFDNSALAAESIEEEVYYLDIPAVDIEQAEVRIGGTNLNQSLIQYPGTADPGELGSPVIFGHSVLRQFYNPSAKNPRRYTSIFSYIMTLKPGDKIYVTHEGAKYTYVVTDKTEVKPEDTYILSQQHNVRALKLVTCTPEGTYLRRGVITAQLVENQ